LQWIHTQLAPELGLQTVPEYKKKEMTSTGVIVILRSLSTHSQHIPCDRKTRVSAHANFLMMAVGGFRPKALLGLTYTDLKVVVLRNPSDRADSRIVITVKIKRVKINTVTACGVQVRRTAYLDQMSQWEARL
jgi:hypothetical protein